VLSSKAFAQVRSDPATLIAAEKDAMVPLAFMDGVWRGPAWTLRPSGEKHGITQTERIGPFLDGSVKVIEGRGYDDDGKRPAQVSGIRARAKTRPEPSVVRRAPIVRIDERKLAVKRFIARPRSWLVLVFLAGSPPLSAAEPVSGEAGAWLPTRVEIRGAGTIAKSWERQLRQIEAAIKATPALQEPAGFYPLLILKAEPPVGGRGPWQGHVAFEAWWPKAIEQTGGAPKVKANWEHNRPPGLWININSRGDLSHWTSWEDKTGRFYLLAEPRHGVAGFPVVSDRFFITRPARPLCSTRSLSGARSSG
jgi:hypothetical protein